MKHIHFETMDSTNTYLKEHYETLDHFTWVSTDFQMHGKGRMSKSWYGDRDSLLCSVLIKNEINSKHIHLIPLLAAKSLHQVLFKYNSNIVIKWPNDLLIRNRKISGILVETVSIAHDFKAVIVGFGINLNQSSFPKDIEEKSTSLFQETNHKHMHQEILKLLQDQLSQDYKLFLEDSSEVVKYCNQYLAYRNQEISYMESNEIHHGYIQEIDEHGHLVINKDNHLIALNSGEITLLK